MLFPDMSKMNPKSVLSGLGFIFGRKGRLGEKEFYYRKTSPAPVQGAGLADEWSDKRIRNIFISVSAQILFWILPKERGTILGNYLSAHSPVHSHSRESGGEAPPH